MSVTVVAKSLSIYGWPAVTVMPLPTPAVMTLRLFRPTSSRECATAGKHTESVGCFFPISALRHSAGCVSFFFHFFPSYLPEWRRSRRASERAAGCGCRADNEGHRKGWRRAAEVEVGPKLAPAAAGDSQKKKADSTRERTCSPSGLDPLFNYI